MVGDVSSLRITGESSSSPLSNWANDDLLLTEQVQRTIADCFPRAFRILDWAVLRDEFIKHDISANRNKRIINHHGVSGALLSAVGASLLTLPPIFPTGIFQSVVVVAGCSLVFGGGLMGLWHLFAHNGRAKWLLNRLWTERLRQFYFQYIVNNFDAAIAAMDDDNNLKKYVSLRDGALKTFINDTEMNLSARGPIEAVRWLADDHEDARAWGRSVWQDNRILPSTFLTDDHRELLECLSRGRIGIQEIYSQLNMKPRSASQGNMARLITFSGNIATFIFVVSLTLAGMWILFYTRQTDFPSDALIACSGVAASWGLYFRLVDQGMGYSSDAERYALYADQVRLVRQQFNAAGDDVRGKIAALRQLEIYTYQEMRQFLTTHLRSRFLG